MSTKKLAFFHFFSAVPIWAIFDFWSATTSLLHIVRHPPKGRIAPVCCDFRCVIHLDSVLYGILLTSVGNRHIVPYPHFWQRILMRWQNL
jgi:hypothetical protein